MWESRAADEALGVFYAFGDADGRIQQASEIPDLALNASARFRVAPSDTRG